MEYSGIDTVLRYETLNLTASETSGYLPVLFQMILQFESDFNVFSFGVSELFGVPH